MWIADVCFKKILLNFQLRYILILIFLAILIFLTIIPAPSSTYNKVLFSITQFHTTHMEFFLCHKNIQKWPLKEIP